ncbi:MAG: thioredoxin family protein [Elusimicrobiales bacterium]|nr:thioredoxin family protein [Elusimicrobiales bacterium]
MKVKIQILGAGCIKCSKLYENAERAAKELGIDYEIEKISDFKKISQMGVVITPALAINGEVKISGRVPSIEALKELFKSSS